MSSAQVGLDHLRVLADSRRRALGDLLAEVSARRCGRTAHHQLHVVLDQQHGVRRSSRMRSISSRSSDFLGRVHAGRRLVQEQQLRLGGQRAGDLQAALVAVGQAARLVLGVAGRCRRSRAARCARSAMAASSRACSRQCAASRRAARRACARGARPSRSPAPSCRRTGGCSGRCARCRPWPPGAPPAACRACRPARTLPASGVYRPVMTLKKVVLPAPLGPIRP